MIQCNISSNTITSPLIHASNRDFFIKLLLTKWKEFTKRCQFMFRFFFPSYICLIQVKQYTLLFFLVAHYIKKSTFFLPLSCIVARTEIALQTLHLLIKISLRQEMRHCYAWYFLMCTNKPPVRKRITVRKKYTIRWSRFSFFFQSRWCRLQY